MPNQLPPGAQQTTRGTIDAVPCPHCGKPQDFRTLAEQSLMDTGHQCSCDDCGYMMEITRIAPVTLVYVRQISGRRQTPQQVDPRRRIAPGQQRLPPGYGPAPAQRGIGAKIRGLLGGPKK